jgi:hypothetical protein
MGNDMFYTDTLECALDCGAKIEVTDKHRGEKCHAAAEALGWATFDIPKKDGDVVRQRTKKRSPHPEMKFGGVVCPDCIEKVRAIYHQVAESKA